MRFSGVDVAGALLVLILAAGVVWSYPRLRSFLDIWRPANPATAKAEQSPARLPSVVDPARELAAELHRGEQVRDAARRDIERTRQFLDATPARSSPVRPAAHTARKLAQ